MDPALCVEYASKKKMLTSLRWYDPDQVQRVKKLQRVSFSAQAHWTPLVSAIQFVLSIHDIQKD